MNAELDPREEIQQEKSRDRWLAMAAARYIVKQGGPEEIETEALEALECWIRSELTDRENRKPEYAQELPF